MSSPYRVCVVCTGNICRSPMGEFMLAEALASAGLDDRVEVFSGGTSAEEAGNPMDPRARDALVRHGHRDLGWDAHRARRFAPDWFDDADLVLAATEHHARTLRSRARTSEQAERVRLIRSFDAESVDSGELEMDDPWYGGTAGFDRTHDEVAAALPGIIEHLRRELA